jgi:hypothetical protein
MILTTCAFAVGACTVAILLLPVSVVVAAVHFLVACAQPHVACALLMLLQLPTRRTSVLVCGELCLATAGPLPMLLSLIRSTAPRCQGMATVVLVDR